MFEVTDAMAPEWYERAACRGRGWSWFFDPSDDAMAKETCSHCNVRLTCLNFALTEDIAYGVWGGLTPEQRRRARSPRTRVA